MIVKLEEFAGSDDWRIVVGFPGKKIVYDIITADFINNAPRHEVIRAIARTIEELTEKLHAFNHPLYDELPRGPNENF